MADIIKKWADLKGVSLLLRVVGWIIIVISLGAFLLSVNDYFQLFTFRWSMFFSDRTLKNWNKQWGSFAEYAFFGSIALWVLKQALRFLKQKTPFFTPLLRALIVFFKEQHLFLGSIVLAASAGHGLYSILYPHDKLTNVYTGLLSFAVLLALAIAGLGFKRSMDRKRASARTRKAHKYLAFLFVAVLLIHLYL